MFLLTRWSLILGLVLFGCSPSGGTKNGKCEAGSSVSCACEAGGLGTATCLDTGEPGECECGVDTISDAATGDVGVDAATEDTQVKDLVQDPADTAGPTDAGQDTSIEDAGVDLLEDTGVEDTNVEE